MSANKGTIVQVMGPVVDVAFPGGSLPELKEAWANPLDCDILTERLLILRMLLGRALARIAPEEGEALLNEMEDCSNRTIALSAQKEKRLLKAGQRRICRKEW